MTSYISTRGEAPRLGFCDVMLTGLARDGAFYLFTLRLIPVVPFFAVNLLMGLTPLPALTYYWVSQVGMLAATVVYVNAGTQLGRLDSLSGIASPALLASFALLGLFPWIARGILGVVKRRKVYARWRRPARFDRNLVVIGAGAVGLSCARALALKGRDVLVLEAAEDFDVGGVVAGLLKAIDYALAQKLLAQRGDRSRHFFQGLRHLGGGDGHLLQLLRASGLCSGGSGCRHQTSAKQQMTPHEQRAFKVWVC